MPLLVKESEPFVADINEEFEILKIEGLNFSYPDSPVKVLHNIHHTFPQKGLVLIKGISGSGKSTLLKICTGSLSAEEGVVSVNGKDNQWSCQWLDANSSYMNQYPFIFDGTLRYNLFLKKEASGKEVFPDFMNLILSKKENGWDTVLSHNGTQLSGGERQLVTLARMMLHPAQIAILDEPTANLDENTTEIIINEIVNMSRNRLVIVASHEQRFESVANTIVNLNWGEQMSYA